MASVKSAKQTAGEDPFGDSDQGDNDQPDDDLFAQNLSWGYSEAKDSFAKKRYGEAIERYQEMYCDVVERKTTDNRDIKGGDGNKAKDFSPHAAFLQTRTSLTHLISGKSQDATNCLKDIFDDVGAAYDKAGPPSVDALEAVCAQLREQRDHVRCAAVALQGHQLHPNDKDAFELILRRCLKERPNLAAEVESIPKASFSKSLFDFGSTASAPARLRAQKQCQKSSILAKRAALCLSGKKGNLAVACLRQLAELPNQELRDKVMYEYMAHMAGYVTGDTLDVDITKQNLRTLADKHPKYLEIHYGLSQVLVKLKLYDEAEAAIKRALTLQSDGKATFFSWPASLAPHFSESKSDILEPMLRRELVLVSTTRAPDAVCRFEDCLVEAEEADGSREIFSDDATGGHRITVSCSDRCGIDFHPLCWKRAKDLRGNTHAGCFTPDCDGHVVEVMVTKDGKGRKDAKDSIFNIKQSKPNRIMQQKAEAAEKKMAAEAAKKQQAARDKHVLKQAAKKVKEQKAVPVRDDSTAAGGGAVLEAVAPVFDQDAFIKPKPKQSAFVKKLARLDSIRSAHQKNLASAGSHVPANLMSAYFNFLSAQSSTNDQLVTMDGHVFPCSASHQEFRCVTDLIRQEAMEYRGEFISQKEALAEERRARRAQVSKELLQERELSYYLYTACKKLMREKTAAESKLRDRQEQLKDARKRLRDSQQMMTDLQQQVRELEARGAAAAATAPMTNPRDSLEPVLRELDRSGNLDMTERVGTGGGGESERLADPAIAEMGVAISPEGDDAIVEVDDDDEEEGSEDSERELLRQIYPDFTEAEIDEALRDHERNEEEDELDEAEKRRDNATAAPAEPVVRAPVAAATAAEPTSAADAEKIHDSVLERMMKMRSDQRRQLLENSIGGGGGAADLASGPGDVHRFAVPNNHQRLQRPPLMSQPPLAAHHQPTPLMAVPPFSNNPALLAQQQQQQQQSLLMQQLRNDHRQLYPGSYPSASQQQQQQQRRGHQHQVPSYQQQSSSTGEECSICSYPLSKEEEFPLDPCGHRNFHHQCVKTWLRENSTCPLCRKYVKLDEDFPSLQNKKKTALWR